MKVKTGNGKQKQIPFGNDSQKCKCKRKCNRNLKYSGPSLRSRMTRFWVSQERAEALAGFVAG
jgi:hypothetical protein